MRKKDPLWADEITRRVLATIDASMDNDLEAAKKLGVRPKAVRTWREDWKTPDMWVVCRTAVVYGVSADYLLGLVDAPEETHAARCVVPPPPVNHGARIANVYEAAAYAFGVTTEGIVGRSRQQWLSAARHSAAWILYNVVGLTLSDAGRAMCRDHSTIIHSLNTVDGWEWSSRVRYRMHKAALARLVEIENEPVESLLTNATPGPTSGTEKTSACVLPLLATA